MRYSKLLDTLQNLIHCRPSQAQLGEILGIRQTAISGRAQRDSEFTKEELFKIETRYALPIGVLSEAEKVNSNIIEIPNLDNNTNVITIDKRFCNIWKVKSENLQWLNAFGDGMSPSIENEDIILLDISQNSVTANGIFLFEINNQRFIKRLRLRVTGELDIISDNEKYPIETIASCSQLKVIGRIIKNLSRGL